MKTRGKVKEDQKQNNMKYGDEKRMEENMQETTKIEKRPKGLEEILRMELMKEKITEESEAV